MTDMNNKKMHTAVLLKLPATVVTPSMVRFCIYFLITLLYFVS